MGGLAREKLSPSESQNSREKKIYYVSTSSYRRVGIIYACRIIRARFSGSNLFS